MDIKKITKDLNIKGDELKPITVEEVRKRLGLKQQDEIVRMSEERGCYPRASGRTTELLLCAATDCLNGEKVTVEGWSNYYSRDLNRQLRRMVYQAGGDPNLVVDRRSNSTYTYTDHSVADVAEYRLDRSIRKKDEPK